MDSETRELLERILACLQEIEMQPYVTHALASDICAALVEAKVSGFAQRFQSRAGLSDLEATRKHEHMRQELSCILRDLVH